MDPDKRKGVLILLTLPLVVGGIVGLVYLGRLQWGSPIGGKCDEAFDCQPHSMCISKRCRRTCSVDADCNPGWGCRSTEVSVSSADKFEFKTIKICFSPEAMAPALERERQAEVAKQARDRRASLDQKKFAVRLQAIVQLTTKPPQLTDAEFDAAWAQIPEQEQASGDVKALAARAIAVARPR